MKEYVLQDRYGYLIIEEGKSPDDAVRRANALSDEACLDYAHTRYYCDKGEMTDHEIDMANCYRAMSEYGNNCQCGYHGE